MIKGRILKKEQRDERSPGQLKRAIIAISLLFVFLCGCAKKNVEYRDMINGACYYLWYPENFTHGFLREALNPPQNPRLGRYNSSDSSVIKTHIQWCRDYGIDFLAVDYWFSRPKQVQVFKESFLPAIKGTAVKFALFMETWEAGYNPATGLTELETVKGDLLIEKVFEVASISFNHPSYLKVDGRPVIFLYLTRIMDENAPRVLKKLRNKLSTLGADPYIVADEIFWKVSSSRGGFSARPDIERINCFDALTSYNLYESQNKKHARDKSGTWFLKDCRKLLKKYRRKSPLKTAIIPGVIPGYNDRGTRPKADHYVIPRTSAEEESFLRRMISELVPLARGTFPMLLVTSFNEWNEDTMIEPVSGKAETNTDISENSNSFTQGAFYEPYEFGALEDLKHATKAFDVVVKRAGQPAADIRVTLLNNKKEVLAEKNTGVDGRVYFSRFGLKDGESYSLKTDLRNEQVLLNKSCQEIIIQ